MPALRDDWSWLEGWRPEAFRGGSRGQRAVGLAVECGYGDCGDAQGVQGGRTRREAIVAGYKTFFALRTMRSERLTPLAVPALRVLLGA